MTLGAVAPHPIQRQLIGQQLSDEFFPHSPRRPVHLTNEQNMFLGQEGFSRLWNVNLSPSSMHHAASWCLHEDTSIIALWWTIQPLTAWCPVLQAYVCMYVCISHIGPWTPVGCWCSILMQDQILAKTSGFSCIMCFVVAQFRVHAPWTVYNPAQKHTIIIQN